MKKLLNYILWPALAGIVFATALLLAPGALNQFPALSAYLPEPRPAPSAATPAPMESYSAAIKKAAPAVVSINSINKLEREIPAWVQRYLSPDQLDELIKQNSLGSGVIISPDGYIVTSYHVFFGDNPNLSTIESEIKITMSGRPELDAKIVALDEKNDLALLKVDEGNLPYLSESIGGPPEAGDVVLAIGNPRNIGQSVSFGIVSALWGFDDSYIIQTDAAINPGNSGGALIDIRGNLIGINSTIVSESGGSEGISFAVPAGKARDLLNEYLSTTPGSYLGVDTNTLSLSQGREKFGADIQGFEVVTVTPGSPADRAGIKAEDVIIGAEGKRIIIPETLDRAEAFRGIEIISSLPNGALVTIEVFRAGRYLQIPTILGKGRPNYSGVEPIEDSASGSQNTVIPAPLD